MSARAGGVARLTWVVLALPPLSAGLFRIWVHSDAVQMGYALSLQERTYAQHSASVRALEVALAAARSPARLMALGQSLGLRPPDPEQRVYVAPPPQPARVAAQHGGHARP